LNPSKTGSQRLLFCWERFGHPGPCQQPEEDIARAWQVMACQACAWCSQMHGAESHTARNGSLGGKDWESHPGLAPASMAMRAPRLPRASSSWESAVMSDSANASHPARDSLLAGRCGRQCGHPLGAPVGGGSAASAWHLRGESAAGGAHATRSCRCSRLLAESLCLPMASFALPGRLHACPRRKHHRREQDTLGS
jgi:hypothetical protein